MAFAMGGYKSLVQNNEESVSSKVEFDKNDFDQKCPPKKNEGVS